MATLRKPKIKHTLVNMGGKQGKIEYIVIHFVGASGQALANANYFYNTYREASAHYFIDAKETYEVVPEGRAAWHVGDGRGRYGITNGNAVGIEGCQDVTTGSNVWEWQFHPNTYEQMILLTVHLMKKYKLGLDRVVRHYDASRKSCPGNWMKNDWAKWKLWKNDLKLYVETGKLIDSQRGITYIDKPGITVTPSDKPLQSKLTNREVAKQVFRGDWGNGQVRKDRLAKAGYDYDAVQAEVAKYKEEINKGTKKPVEIPKSIGIYKFNTKVWVRTEPHEGKASITEEGYMYSPNDTVSLEKIIERDGVIWGQYTSYSGKQRFVKIGHSGGKQFAIKL